MSSQIRKSLTRKKIIKKKHYIYQKGQTIGKKMTYLCSSRTNMFHEPISVREILKSVTPFLFVL